MIKLLLYASPETKVHFIIVTSMDSKTRFMITEASITSKIAKFKAVLISSLETGNPFTRTVFYAEYKCTGPGSNLAARPAWIR
ncbi:hypothetical protein A2U01_0014371, partial [Trifolium medium]|nr:hypothetical protein [Trifolium medium]